MKSIQDQMSLIKRGCVDFVTEKELVSKLEEKKTLRVKAGFDPTAPDLHLGHTVVMHKLRQFQDLGHKIVFIIGDFTARIGDPSGRTKMRPSLSDSEIAANLKTYIDQASKILDMDKAELRYNSEWLSKMTFIDVVKLASNYTVARMMEREDFKNRYAAGDALGIHEFLYPLMQGYDSIAVNADVELGGSDQIFNLLVGRDLQRSWGQEAQVVMTFPLLVGTDGVQKMSKSYGNYIGISEPASDMFGKIMSISDSLMWTYYELLSAKSADEITCMKQKIEAAQLNPKVVKEGLALELVARFHSETEALKAKENFDKIFSKKMMPDEIQLYELNASNSNLINALNSAGIVASKSEARRLIQQGAVDVDGKRIKEIDFELSFGDEHIVKCGKRKFARIKVTR